MLFFDAHCDILSLINSPEELFYNTHHWDTERALKNGPFVQVFSSFAGDKFRDNPKIQMEAQINKALAVELLYPKKLKLIRSTKDMDEAENKASKNMVYGLLEAEGAEILGGSIGALDRLYGMGLRILTLAWNYDNEVCDSAAGLNTHNGLSRFGSMVVKRAQELGVIIDVSHASDKTFEDLLPIIQKPIVASHSNSRELCCHRRNLKDDQIREIAKIGGVIGINFYPFFLKSTGNTKLTDIIRHIEYVVGLVGTKYVGFGSDFDGFTDLPESITGVESLYLIIETLLKLNYSQADCEAIAGGNFINLFKRII